MTIFFPQVLSLRTDAHLKLMELAKSVKCLTSMKNEKTTKFLLNKILIFIVFCKIKSTNIVQVNLIKLVRKYFCVCLFSFCMPNPRFID